VKLLDLVAGIFKPAAELIGELHTSEEERLAQKARLLEVQAATIDKALEYERGAIEGRAKIVQAEAQSEHVITATWRPIVMLCFCALAVGDALGLLPNPLAPEAWLLLQIGLGGYVVGRSGEKVVRAIKESKVGS